MMNFEFKCPQCGQMVEADEAYRGQVAECPHCGKGIVIPRATVPIPPVASKADSKTENTHNQGMKWKIKKNSEQGQQSIAEEGKNSTAPDNPEQTLLGRWKVLGPVRKLIIFLWAGLALDAISGIIGLFDVREYYALGRIPNFVYDLLALLMGAWLVIAISHRKSWARKLYVILSLLALVFISCNFNESMSDNALIALIDLLSFGISIFCVVMCFSKEVREEFLPDAMLKGPKALINRYQCMAYVAVIIIFLVGSYFVGYKIGVTYYGSGEWLANCTEAAALGSESARNDLIEKLTDEYVVELPEKSQEDEVQIAILKKRATRECDALIKSHSKYSKSHKGAADTSRSRIADFLLSKGIAKILVAFFVACVSSLGLKFVRMPSVISVLTIVLGSIIFATIRYKYSHQSVPEPSKSTESVERNSENVEAHPTSTENSIPEPAENSIPIPVIKNSDGVYDWQSMCQREWPKSFLEIQKAFSVFGGFQLAQPPIDGFNLEEGHSVFHGQVMVQKDVPLQKKYRYFQKADLQFFHGALIDITLKAHFEKKYSMASIDREFKTLQDNVNESFKCLDKTHLGLGWEFRTAYESPEWEVTYGLSPSPSVHEFVGRIRTTLYLKQADNGYDLTLSVNAGNGLESFINLVIKKEAYEAGEELEGFDKKQQSSNDSTKEHQIRNQVSESTERKAEEGKTRSAKAETLTPSPTISMTEGKEASPNQPDESTDSRAQTVVRQPAERKAEEADDRSTRTETPVPSPTIPAPKEQEASPNLPDESTDPQPQTVARPNPHFEAAKKHDWQRLCQKEWSKSFLVVQEIFSEFGGFKLAQAPIVGIEFDTEDIQKDVPLQKQYRYFKKGDLEFFNGALVGFTLKAHFAKSYSKASVERECKAFEDDVVKKLGRLEKPGLGIGLDSTFPSHPWQVEYGASPSPGVHKMLGTIIVSYDLRQDDYGYDLTLSVDAQRGMREFIELVLEKEADETGDELEEFDKKQQSKGKDPHRNEASQSPAERTSKTVKITGFGSYKFGQKYLATRMTAEMWQEGGLAIKPVQTRYRKFKTLELGYAIDGKQLCHIKLCAEFPSNADDNQLRTELKNVKGDLERQLGFEMTEDGDEATYEDENYIVRLWHESTTKTVYNTQHVGFRNQRVASTVNIKGLYLLLENKRLMPK